MRAYRAADISNDGFIDRKEFKNLVHLLYYYNDLYVLFKEMDADHDKRISFKEFCKGHEMIGIHLKNKADLKKVFNSIDTNGGGMILFDEFCMFMAKQKILHV